MENTEYSKKIYTTVNGLAKKYLESITPIIENGLFDPSVSDEDRKAQEEKMVDFQLEFIKTIAETDLQWTKVELIFLQLESLLQQSKTFIKNTVSLWDNEISSRNYGVKTAEGKFRKEEVPVSVIIKALEDARKATGDNKEDFYN